MSLIEKDKLWIRQLVRNSQNALDIQDFSPVKRFCSEQDIFEYLLHLTLLKLQETPDISSKILWRYLYAIDMFMDRWDFGCVSFDDKSWVILEDVFLAIDSLEDTANLNSKIMQLRDRWKNIYYMF